MITKTGNRYILHIMDLDNENSEDAVLDKLDLVKYLAVGHHKLKCEECKKDA